MKHIAMEPKDEYKMKFSFNPTDQEENVNLLIPKYFPKILNKID